MRKISVVFLIITISACVVFNTQPNRKIQNDHETKPINGKTGTTHKRTDNEQQLASVQTMKKSTLDMGQQNRDVYSNKKKVTRNDQRRVIDKGKRPVNNEILVSTTNTRKYEGARYKKTKRGVYNRKKSMYGRQKKKSKKDDYVKVNERRNSKYKEGSYIKKNRAVYNKRTSKDGQEKRVTKVGRYGHNNNEMYKKKSKNYGFNFGNEEDKMKQNNSFLFEGGLFRFHHAMQKRDLDKRRNIRRGWVNEHMKISQIKCSLGESDVERNCESLFQCSHNENKTNPNCYCDELCPLFDDCCQDSNPSSLVISEIYGVLLPRIHCGTIEKFLTYGKYQVVTTCPRTYTNINISKQCEITFSTEVIDPLLIIPVTDPLQVTYKNLYCALCNGISDFRLWTIEYDDVDIRNIDDYTWEDFPSLLDHVMVFPPDDLPVRFCNGYAVTESQEEDHVTGNGSDTNNCNSFGRFLNISFLHLDNSCLTAAWENKYCSPDHVVYTNCSDCVPHIFSTKGSMTWGFHRLHVLFTFNMANNDCDNSHKISASQGEDPLYICPTSSLLNPYYILECHFRIEGNLSQNTLDFLGTSLFSYFNALTDSEINLQFSRPVYQPKDCDIQRIHMVLRYLTKVSNNHWKKLAKWYDNLNWTYTEFHNRGKVVVSKVSPLSMQNGTVCDIIKSRMEAATAFIKKHFAIFPNLPRTQRFCQNVHFTLELNNPNTSVFGQLNQLKVSESDCVGVMNVQNSQDIFDYVMTIVSNTLMGIGCITLFCSLVSTVILKVDLSIPGLITRHMMITTLLFQFFFIVGIGATDSYFMCFSFGVILHYCTLCVFAWMSICVGYLAKTLIKIKKSPGNMHGHDKKYRFFLICFGYILPSLIVIPSVIIDTCQCTSFSIGYGTGICFPNPSAYPEGLLVFVGPISVHILFNIVCLSVSIFELSRARVNVAVLSISRSYTPIYLKLCVYSGIGWIFGIASLVLPFEVIKVLFTASCSSQGLFLSVITLCNIRVLRQLRLQLSTSNKEN